MTVETMPAVEPLERVRTASDVLLAAARLIEEHGWWQGPDDDDDDATRCLMLAIDDVGGTIDVRLGARQRVMGVIGARNLRAAFEWNDTPGRTEAEVIAALREAAAR